MITLIGFECRKRWESLKWPALGVIALAVVLAILAGFSARAGIGASGPRDAGPGVPWQRLFPLVSQAIWLYPLLDAGWATEIRQAGLWVGVDVQPSLGTAKEICYRLMERAVLAKDTHGHTIRFAPPLVITEDDLDQVIAHTITAFEEAAAHVGDVRSDVETQIDA